jgi:hypothetical protein
MVERRPNPHAADDSVADDRELSRDGVAPCRRARQAERQGDSEPCCDDERGASVNDPEETHRAERYPLALTQQPFQRLDAGVPLAVAKPD